jgi:hypothetical protein
MATEASLRRGGLIARACDHPHHQQFGLGHVPGPRRPDSVDYQAVVAGLPAEYISTIPAPVLNQGSLPQCEAYTAATGKTLTTFPLAVAAGFSPAIWSWDTQDLFTNAHGTPDGTTTALMEAALLSPGALATSGPDLGQRLPVQSCLNISTLSGMQSAVYNQQFAGLAVSWYESWFNPIKGVLPKPGGGVAGGHIFTIRGWSTSRASLYCQNSWGTAWGLGGYFWMPYAYLESTPSAYTQYAAPLVPPATYTPRTSMSTVFITPVRILDTRTGTMLNPGENRKVLVGGAHGIPANAVGVAGNLTFSGPTANGWLAVTPTTYGPGPTSTANFIAGQVPAGNGFDSGLATDGTFNVHNGSLGQVNIILDITSYDLP